MIAQATCITVGRSRVPIRKSCTARGMAIGLETEKESACTMTKEKLVSHPEWVPATSLGDALPVKLLRARESVMQFYRPLFRSCGITERQWRILRSLYDEVFLEPSELARRAFMQPPNVSRVLSELRKLGYIERVSDDGDQRRARVTLTDGGRTACAAIGAKIDARTAKIKAEADSAGLAKLGVLLDMAIDLSSELPHLADTDH